jgi:hypothetical protein
LGVVCGKSSATWQVVAVQSAAEFQGKAMPNEVKLGELQGGSGWQVMGRGGTCAVPQQHFLRAIPHYSCYSCMLRFQHGCAVVFAHDVPAQLTSMLLLW